jgi:hypothetical protein
MMAGIALAWWRKAYISITTAAHRSGPTCGGARVSFNIVAKLTGSLPGSLFRSVMVPILLLSRRSSASYTPSPLSVRDCGIVYLLHTNNIIFLWLKKMLLAVLATAQASSGKKKAT